MSVLLLFLSGCTESFVCESCEQTSTGKSYYGMGGNEVMCEDCARTYWMPLDYRKFEWDSIPTQEKTARAEFESSEPASVDPMTNDSSQEEDGQSVLIDEITKRLDAYDASGDVNGALGYLIQQMDLMEITFGQKDSGLLDRLESYRTAYQQQVLQEAMDAFAQDGYKSAVKLLYEAQGLLGTENEEISKAIAYYEGFGPVWLVALDYFSREAGMFGSIYWNENYDTLNTDSEGTEHTHAMYTEVCTRTATQTYLIDGKYAQFTGTVYLPKESREMDEDSYFRVYGDGILLYTSPAMREGVRAVPFSIDVTNVSQLMIAADSDGNPFYHTLCIGEAYLEP
jgi:hypothetical protein